MDKGGSDVVLDHAGANSSMPRPLEQGAEFARVFEHSLRAPRGRLSQRKRDTVQAGNGAVHCGDLVAVRALFMLGMRQYRREFERIYVSPVEEAVRFKSPTIIKTLNKRATLHATGQWNSQLVNDFKIAITFHDTCCNRQWNRFIRSDSSPEALAWLKIENAEVHRELGTARLSP